MHLILESPAPNLEESLRFYRILNFQTAAWNNGWLCQAKGLSVFLNPDPFSRPRIILLGAPQKTLEASPSGTWVKQEKIHLKNPSTSQSILGNFHGVCLETLNLKASHRFWKSKGFQGTLAHGASWGTFSNKMNHSISLMQANSCPHLFTNPSLAFFNGKNNSAIIQQIKALQLPIRQEIIFEQETIADNIILNDPGGLGFFIFND